jgi:Sap, sulfolipid-1-addressing protein
VWPYVLMVGVGVFMDPTRLGLAAILMSRRQAVRSLLAFWLGGMLAGISVGIVVLVLFHDVALVAIQNMVASMNEVRSAVGFSGGRLQIAFGMLALVGLAVLVARQRARAEAPIAVGSGGVPGLAPQPSKSSFAARMGQLTVRMVESGGHWPAFIVGLGSTVPPIEGPVALTVIMASKNELGTQFSAFVVFTLMMLLFVEIPLLSYWAAPQRTEAVMLRLNTWIHGHRPQIVQATLALAGVVFVVQGVGRL